jgi:hypothetical protein
MATGFGQEPFGEMPFGNTDWCYHVLYDELPSQMQQQDQDEGGLYEAFVKAASIPINRMRELASGFDSSMRDPIRIRIDLLQYYASRFGIDVDPELREDVRRMRVDIFSRYRLIKGTRESIVVLARIHGFDLTLSELWWNGTTYIETSPVISWELLGVIP